MMGMQLLNAFFPATLIAITGMFTGSQPVDGDALPTKRTFTVSVAHAAEPVVAELADAPGDGTTPNTVLRSSPSDNLFYVTALVNGKPVRFLVDTGASVVVLTAADARTAAVEQMDGPDLDVETVVGLSAMRPVNLARVNLAGQSITNVDGVVVDANLKTSLLGQSVLSRLRSVRFAGDRLELN